jgi:putative flavoprotein involved in K+ transport
MERVEVVVVGGGQAGLAMSHQLTAKGAEHVVLERAKIGQTWRDRWDSFCLVTPNWSVQLPGHHYDGNDPDGYMPRDDIVTYLENYAAAVEAPVRAGVGVRALKRTPDGGFIVETSADDLQAGSVVLATGAYQRPYVPEGASTLPADLMQIDLTGYRNPAALPDGKVLVIGSGQSGCQLAEELHEAGREVTLSCGRAPWAPRRIGGRDLVWWLVEGGFMDAGVETLPDPTARLISNPLATGHGGGHDLNLRTLRAMGVTLAGRFLGATGHRVSFASDLGQSVAWGDERYSQLMDLVRKVVKEQGLEMPEVHEPEPFDAEAPEDVSLDGFGATIFTGGFRPDYSSLAPWEEAFDDLGFPIQRDGASSVVDGLYFVGVHFLRRRKSSLLLGVGEDAAIVAQAISERR